MGHKIYVVEVTLFGVLIYMSDLSSEMMDVCVCVEVVGGVEVTVFGAS